MLRQDDADRSTRTAGRSITRCLATELTLSRNVEAGIDTRVGRCSTTSISIPASPAARDATEFRRSNFGHQHRTTRQSSDDCERDESAHQFAKTQPMLKKQLPTSASSPQIPAGRLPSEIFFRGDAPHRHPAPDEVCRTLEVCIDIDVLTANQ